MRAVTVITILAAVVLIGCSREEPSKKTKEDQGRAAVAARVSPAVAQRVSPHQTTVVRGKEIARCAAIPGDLDRLGCFDSLAKKFNLNGPQPLPTSVSGTGKWVVSHDKNPVDDSERVVIALEADSGAGRFGESVSFVARCQSKKTEAYINWNSYLGDDSGSVYSEWKYITTRVGNEPASTEQWDISTDKKATFAPGRVESLLKKMASANKFLAQVTPYGENPTTAIFDTTGMRSALKPLASACGWKMQ